MCQNDSLLFNIHPARAHITNMPGEFLVVQSVQLQAQTISMVLAHFHLRQCMILYFSLCKYNMCETSRAYYSIYEVDYLMHCNCIF